MPVYYPDHFDFGDIKVGDITLGSGNTGNTTFGNVDLDIGHTVGGSVASAQEAYCAPPSPYFSGGDITVGNITLGSGNTGNTTFGNVDLDIGHSFG